MQIFRYFLESIYARKKIQILSNFNFFAFAPMNHTNLYSIFLLILFIFINYFFYSTYYNKNNNRKDNNRKDNNRKDNQRKQTRKNNQNIICI